MLFCQWESVQTVHTQNPQITVESWESSVFFCCHEVAVPETLYFLKVIFMVSKATQHTVEVQQHTYKLCLDLNPYVYIVERTL